MMTFTLWIMVGFLAILTYPHTPGLTNITSFRHIVLIVLLWPVAWWQAYEFKKGSWS